MAETCVTIIFIVWPYHTEIVLELYQHIHHLYPADMARQVYLDQHVFMVLGGESVGYLMIIWTRGQAFKN